MYKVIIAVLLIVSCFAKYGSLKDQKDYQQDIKKLSELIQSQNYKGKSWQKLAYLTDTFGPRMWGTKTLQAAIQFMHQKAIQVGFDNIRLQPVVNFEAWIRGHQQLTMISPRIQKLDVIGLGGSISTGATGIKNAEVVVVESFDQLNSVNVSGKVVCFNNPWMGYHTSAQYRVDGPSIAAAKGAIAMLVRSVASSSIYSVHAGYMQYNQSVHKIPAAAITVQDAQMFSRIQKRGDKIIINLQMNSQWSTRNSSNLVFEIQGSDPQLKKQIIVMGGHIDTWDTGSQTGANDDGGGFITVFQALRMLFENGFKPRRTMRFVAWSGQQSGSLLDGAAQYYKKHLIDQQQKHVAGFQSDLGSTRLLGFHHLGKNKDLVIQILDKYLKQYNIGQYGTQVMTADIQQMNQQKGVTIFANKIKDTQLHDFYFRYHHTAGDSMTMMNPQDMDSNVFGISAFMYIIADLQHSVDWQSQNNLRRAIQ